MKKPRKRPKPLPSREVFRRVKRMVKLVDREVRVGLEVRASLEAANTIIRSQPGIYYDAASCVSSIQGSQAMFLSLALAKLFELPHRSRGETHARRYNRSDVASIPLLVRLLKQERTRQHLVRKARRWTPMLKHSGDKNAKDCGDAIAAAIGAYDAFRKSKAGRSAMRRLQLFRNKLLAHLLVTPPLRVRSTYGELFRLMDLAREVVAPARLAIDGMNLDLPTYEKERVRVANVFWRPALKAAMSKEAQ